MTHTHLRERVSKLVQFQAPIWDSVFIFETPGMKNKDKYTITEEAISSPNFQAKQQTSTKYFQHNHRGSKNMVICCQEAAILV